jgi:hypothetical protein
MYARSADCAIEYLKKSRGEMNNENDLTNFEGWAIIELFGHNQIAGYVTDAPMFGTSMMRVDVSDIEGHPGYTKYFGGSAIYAITPTTKEIAIEATKRLDVRPVANWIVPDRQLQLPDGQQTDDEEGDLGW